MGQRGPLNEARINYLVAEYAYQARLKYCTSHILRHTFAKNLVDADTPLDQGATFRDMRAWIPPECIPDRAKRIWSRPADARPGSYEENAQTNKEIY